MAIRVVCNPSTLRTVLSVDSPPGGTRHRNNHSQPWHIAGAFYFKVYRAMTDNPVNVVVPPIHTTILQTSLLNIVPLSDQSLPAGLFLFQAHGNQSLRALLINPAREA